MKGLNMGLWSIFWLHSAQSNYSVNTYFIVSQVSTASLNTIILKVPHSTGKGKAFSWENRTYHGAIMNTINKEIKMILRCVGSMAIISVCLGYNVIAFKEKILKIGPKKKINMTWNRAVRIRPKHDWQVEGFEVRSSYTIQWPMSMNDSESVETLEFIIVFRLWICS